MATFRSCLKISQPLPKSRNSHTHSFPHIAPLLPFQFANQNFLPHLLSSFLTFKKFYVIIFKKTIFSFALPSLHPHIPLSPLTPLTSLPLNLYPYIFNRHLPHLPNTQLSFLLLIFIKKYVIILKKSILFAANHRNRIFKITSAPFYKRKWRDLSHLHRLLPPYKLAKKIS